MMNSLLSNPENDIHFMQYKDVKNSASHKGLKWTKYNHKYTYKYYQIDIHYMQYTIL